MVLTEYLNIVDSIIQSFPAAFLSPRIIEEERVDGDCNSDFDDDLDAEGRYRQKPGADREVLPQVNHQEQRSYHQESADAWVQKTFCFILCMCNEKQ